MDAFFRAKAQVFRGYFDNEEHLMTVTITTADGDRQRINLPKSPVWEGRREIGTGVTIEAIYVGKISRRVIAEYESRWDNGRGGTVGRYWAELDHDQIAAACAWCDELAAEWDRISKPADL
jgi:hypothetical protein